MSMKRYAGSLLVGATLMSPVALKAGNTSAQVPLKKASQETVETEVRTRRYYDPDFKDYHEWNEAEERAYRHWLMEERREHEFRTYNRIPSEEQREYWKWRHEHRDWK